jgi:glycosyltransferase A (GT-A) superfamily protein (DUF2064 family)/8-oxo-dGTP pyrophosphatase MutT (NUDIX family)
MNKIHENAVVILAKKPKFGKIKTRISKDTSDSFALKLAMASLEDLLSNLANSGFYDLIVATDCLEDLEWFEENYHIGGITTNVAKDANLSESMKGVFGKLLNEYDYNKAVLIPMDLPFIQTEELINAFSRMEVAPYVVGPETNGGIYLIGIKNGAFEERVFDEVPWSTPHSSEGLIKNFGWKNTYSLKLKDDINTFQDILINKDNIKLYCPRLFEVLSKEGYYFDASNHFVDFDSLNICIPTVSAIVERVKQGKAEILVQTRNKPSTDPVYTNKLEVISGLIERYEEIEAAVIREVKEETGLDVTIIGSGKHREVTGDKNDTVVDTNPFCVSQQTAGGRSYLNLGFICRLKDDGETPNENKFESKNPHWIDLAELEKLLTEKESNFMLLNVPLLKKYLLEKK